MPYNILPFIIKRHGCIKYSKYVFLPKHQFATGPKKTPQKARIIAAPAAAVPAQVVGNLDCSKKSNLKSSNHETLNSVDNSALCSTANDVSEAPDTGDSLLPAHYQSHESPALYFKNSNHYIIPDFSLSQNSKDSPEILGLKTVPLLDVEVLNIQSAPNNKLAQMGPATTLIDAIKPSETEWHEQIIRLKSLPRYYMSLSKIRLTGLVVLTTLAGYGMAFEPVAPLSLISTVVGTGLTSAAANSINQFLEVPYDSQMSRTKNRVLVRGILTPIHAFAFAVCTGTMGLIALYFGANGLTAALGATNLVLYTSIYTPLKRCSIINTWVGSIVGAIPPVMGWAACAGSLNTGALLMGAILYSWQFPHFNALSWNLRPDYSRAGYRMMSVINPLLCRKVALRHSIAILVFCSLAPVTDLTTWTFAIDSLPLNCYFIYRAWEFYKHADSQSSRKLFRLSLIHLPILMLLMFIGKKHPIQDDTKMKEDCL